MGRKRERRGGSFTVMEQKKGILAVAQREKNLISDHRAGRKALRLTKGGLVCGKKGSFRAAREKYLGTPLCRSPTGVGGGNSSESLGGEGPSPFWRSGGES